MPPTFHRHRRPVSPLMLALGLAWAAGASAETSPYSISLSQGFAHESNLYRAPNGSPPTPDLYSVTSLSGAIDQPFGRQRFYANGSVSETRYQDVTALNNTGYGLDTGLN